MTRAEINRKLLLLGLSPKHKGFHHLSEILFNMSTDSLRKSPEEMIRIVSESKRVNLRQIASSMRYAICYAWDVSNGEIHKVFPNYDAAPTLTEFLYVFMWELET